MKEEKPEEKDLLADLQDISDSERKTSTAESSLGNWLLDSYRHFQMPSSVITLLSSKSEK